MTIGTIRSPWRYDLARRGAISCLSARGHVPQRCDHFGIGLSPLAPDGIDPRDFNAGGEQFSQPVLDPGHKLRIATTHRNGMSSHFRKVVGRERQRAIRLESTWKAAFCPNSTALSLLTNKY
jgi:hypothetical protein